MSPSDKTASQHFISTLLNGACEKAFAGQYSAGIAIVKAAKAYDPHNAYLHSLEFRIQTLLEAEQRNVLSEELLREFTQSLPVIVDQAVEATKDLLLPEDGGEKYKGLESLKSTLFRRADQYIENGEFFNALAEIQRVYIIEPANLLAKHYEFKIKEMSLLRMQGGSPEKPKNHKPAEQNQNRRLPVLV